MLQCQIFTLHGYVPGEDEKKINEALAKLESEGKTFVSAVQSSAIGAAAAMPATITTVLTIFYR